MAKKEVSESDLARTKVLKKELQRLVNAIGDEEDLNIDNIEGANRTLWALKDLQLKKLMSLELEQIDPSDTPPEFRCPISKQLMRDPVVVASGQTYDRVFIQRWFNAGKKTCPKTKNVLLHALLTPNYLIRDMILNWCKKNGFNTPELVVQQCGDEGELTESEKNYFLSLLAEISSSTLSDQKRAANDLRFLTKTAPSFRGLFIEIVDAIPQLINPFSESNLQTDIDPDLQEDLITILYNISLGDSSKKFIAETPGVVPLLMGALGCGGIETRANAAAALFTLAGLESNRSLIGEAGAFKPLIELLEEGHVRAVKDVANAIFRLCISVENKARAVEAGAVRVTLEKIKIRLFVDEMVTTLSMLSSNQAAVEELGNLGAIPSLFSIIRESSNDITQENCIVIINAICIRHRRRWEEIREEESAHGTITYLLASGTARAQRRARGILARLNKPVYTAW